MGHHEEKFPSLFLNPSGYWSHHLQSFYYLGVTADTSTISWKFIPEEEEVVNREEEPQVQMSEQWWEAPESFLST